MLKKLIYCLFCGVLALGITGCKQSEKQDQIVLLNFKIDQYQEYTWLYKQENGHFQIEKEVKKNKEVFTLTPLSKGKDKVTFIFVKKDGSEQGQATYSFKIDQNKCIQCLDKKGKITLNSKRIQLPKPNIKNNENENKGVKKWKKK